MTIRWEILARGAVQIVRPDTLLSTNREAHRTFVAWIPGGRALVRVGDVGRLRPAVIVKWYPDGTPSASGAWHTLWSGRLYDLGEARSSRERDAPVTLEDSVRLGLLAAASEIAGSEFPEALSALEAFAVMEVVMASLGMDRGGSP